MARRLRRDEYTVGWVCALPVELAAAQKMLDEEHGTLKPNEGLNHDTDENLYALGSIGGHNVAIGYLPAGRIGISPAAAVAIRMRTTFPGLRFGLMVGIGGGVPIVEDIRLGDVVVSQPNHIFGGVVQYDSGKATLSGFQRTGSLDSPPEVLLKAIARVQANQLLGRSRLSAYVAELGSSPIFQRNKTGPDILFQASYEHENGQTCDACSTERRIIRPPRDSENVVVHYGTIASGNQVIKNAVERDKVSAELGGVLCFEMEAAGLMNNFPCVVIRGICDYADSHKNKRWQPYAAGTAAAYAKELLSVIPPADVADIRTAEERITGPFDVRVRNETPITKECGDGSRVYSPANPQDPEQLPAGSTITSCLPLKTHENIGVPNPELPSQNSLDTRLDTSLLSQDQRKEILNDLHFKQRDARLLSLKLAQARTCSWMLKNVHYKKWTAANKLNIHHGFFWIKGKPGAGKSIMMKYLFNGAKRSMKGCLVLSFFFNARGEPLEKSTRGLYRSLLLQLLEKAPEAWSIFNVYGERGVETMRDMDWQDETLRELLTLALQELENRRVVCYVDALDECPEDDVREMVAFFEELGELEKRAEFRVCFSSRHYPEISIRTGLQLVLETEQEHKNDISVYIDTHLKLGGDSQAEDIKADILRKSSGIFLWVHLVIPILNKEYDQGRIKALKKKLTTIPTELHDLFHEMLTRDDKDIDYLFVGVLIVLFASRPLKPDEFRVAVETHCEEDHRFDSYKLTPESLRKFVLDVSKGLAEITKSKEPTVQFIHESVRDFFLKEGGLKKLRSDTENFEGLGHEIMKKICLHQFSSYYEVKKKLEYPRPNLENFPFLQYATENICVHANSAQKLGLDQASFLKDFKIEAWRRAALHILFYPSSRHLLNILAKCGSAELIRIHPERSKYLVLKDGSFGNPLLAALYCGHGDAARAFVDLPPQEVEELNTTARAKTHQKNARLRESYKLGREFLSYLCEFGDVELLEKVLLSENLVPFGPNRRASQCLELASTEAVVEKLAEFGIFQFRFIDSSGEIVPFGACTPPHIDSGKTDDQAPLASTDDESLTDIHLPYLEFALQNNPSIFDDPIWGDQPHLLAYAASKGFHQIARLCIKNTTVKDRRYALVAAVNGRINQQGRIAIMEDLIKEGLALERNDPLKTIMAQQLFHAICLPYNEDVVAFLLSTSLVDMSCVYDGFTIFHWAVQQGRKAYAKLFLSFGCNPMVRDSRQATVLIHAVKVGDLTSFRCILQNEMCEPDLRDESGRTALMWCAIVADECAVTMASELLGRADVDPNSKDNSGQTTLLQAVQSGNLTMVKMLLQFETLDPDHGPARGNSPLRLAFKLYLETKSYTGHESQVFWEISKLLLQTGKVDPDSVQRLPAPSAIARNNGLSRLVRLIEVFYRSQIFGSLSSDEWDE